MSWLQLHIYIKPQQVQQLEDALELCSAISITFQDRADEPIYEPGVGETPLWPSIKATALFNPDLNTGNHHRYAVETNLSPEQNFLMTRLPLMDHGF